VQVSLYTPAHQGIANNGNRLSQEIYQYDVPFLTRPRTESEFLGEHPKVKTKYTRYLNHKLPVRWLTKIPTLVS